MTRAEAKQILLDMLADSLTWYSKTDLIEMILSRYTDSNLRRISKQVLVNLKNGDEDDYTKEQIRASKMFLRRRK